MAEKSAQLRILNDEIVACRKCPRLVAYREEVAREKRRAFREWTYWGRPVPGFGDSNAQLLILGLAPAAHGGNRTGRVFTGDRSGDFLYAALYKAGFANQPTSVRRDDGLQLKNAYVAASVRCAPPANKPLPSEIVNCLGKIAWDAYLEILKHSGVIASRAAFQFAHGAEAKLPGGRARLFGIYHPSQQNTQTGRVTPAMYAQVLRRIRRFLSNQDSK
jgi:uracil-DNA glycosylase family 4